MRLWPFSLLVLLNFLCMGALASEDNENKTQIFLIHFALFGDYFSGENISAEVDLTKENLSSLSQKLKKQVKGHYAPSRAALGCYTPTNDCSSFAESKNFLNIKEPVGQYFNKYKQEFYLKYGSSGDCLPCITFVHRSDDHIWKRGYTNLIDMDRPKGE